MTTPIESITRLSRRFHTATLSLRQVEKKAKAGVLSDSDIDRHMNKIEGLLNEIEALPLTPHGVWLRSRAWQWIVDQDIDVELNAPTRDRRLAAQIATSLASARHDKWQQRLGFESSIRRMEAICRAYRDAEREAADTIESELWSPLDR